VRQGLCLMRFPDNGAVTQAAAAALQASRDLRMIEQRKTALSWCYRPNL